MSDFKEVYDQNGMLVGYVDINGDTYDAMGTPTTAGTVTDSGGNMVSGSSWGDIVAKALGFATQYQLQQQMISTNQQRIAKGLPPLTANQLTGGATVNPAPGQIAGTVSPLLWGVLGVGALFAVASFMKRR
jgi:hypothetical protein